ncbi:MAG: class I SAM-dependent methyltransferase [Pyrinomonadaceae bacterium]|nr:class I SAM-dependent methyltransferase [Pyrinomonadaceae bacterium]
MERPYDNFATYYDRVFRPFERLYLAAARRETIAELPENAMLLEVGAGTGANFEYYPRFRSAVASELSPQMLGHARTKTSSIALTQADAQQLPFPDDRFDAAFATLVFCTIPDPARAFGELSRVVKPGGLIVLFEHVRPSGILGYVFDVLSRATVALIDDHFDRRTAETARLSGLEIIEIRSKAFGIFNLIVARVGA